MKTKVYFFNLEGGKMLRYIENGHVVIEEELIEKLQQLKDAVEKEDYNRIIELLSEDKRNRRFISYMKRAKKAKVKKRYILKVKSLLSVIDMRQGVEKSVRLRYDTSKDRMYLLVFAGDRLSGVWKEYDITLRDFFEILRGRLVFIDYRGSVFEASFKRRFTNEGYLKYKEKIVEKWIDEEFKGKSGKYYRFFGWVEGDKKKHIHIIEEEVDEVKV